MTICDRCRIGIGVKGFGASLCFRTLPDGKWSPLCDTIILCDDCRKELKARVDAYTETQGEYENKLSTIAQCFFALGLICGSGLGVAVMVFLHSRGYL